MTKPALLRLAASVFAGALALLLTGCAATRMIDSDVQSYSAGGGAVAPATYRFERLPSQAAAADQDQLETLTVAALAKVGLSRNPVTPRYSMQVALQIDTIQPAHPSILTRGFWNNHHDLGRGGMALMLEPSWYRHSVHLQLRDSAGGEVVYETSAVFDGPWADTANLLPAMLDAALQGYPQAPAGPRKVAIELPPPANAAN